MLIDVLGSKGEKKIFFHRTFKDKIKSKKKMNKKRERETLANKVKRK